MATIVEGGTIAAVTETPEILDIFTLQKKTEGGTTASVTDVPEITLIGLNGFVTAAIDSTSSLLGQGYRIRRRGGMISGVSELSEVSKVAVLPERFFPTGQLLYNGEKLNNKTVTKGSYLPLVFELSGDRLTADMNVIFEAESTSRQPLFTKEVRLGVLDENVTTLPDGRDSISGTIVILPSDTSDLSGILTEVRYAFRLANSNIRNYYLESGIFVVKDS